MAPGMRKQNALIACAIEAMSATTSVCRRRIRAE